MVRNSQSSAVSTVAFRKPIIVVRAGYKAESKHMIVGEREIARKMHMPHKIKPSYPMR
jgi:hypothetical protein